MFLRTLIGNRLSVMMWCAGLGDGIGVLPSRTSEQCLLSLWMKMHPLLISARLAM